MNIVDIAEVLRQHNNKIRDVKVYGRLSEEISKPSALSDRVSESRGKYMKLDIVAVDLNSISYWLQDRGIISEDNKFYTRGTLSTFVPISVGTNQWCTLSGTLALSNRTTRPVVGMYNLRKQDKGWEVHTTKYAVLLYQSLSRLGSVQEYLKLSMQYNTILLPDEAENIPPCIYDVDFVGRVGAESLKSFRGV